MPTKQEYLRDVVEHIDPTSFNAVPIIDQMTKMAFQARNLGRACKIVDKMHKEDLTVILTLAGCTISAGMLKCLTTLMKHNMVDAIVSTGATMIDMDLLEALGYKHYMGKILVDDEELRQLNIDRIYDTFIDEDDLRVVDEVTYEVAKSLPIRPHSSREIMHAFGKYLVDRDMGKDSVLRLAYEKQIPIFTPSFSDCSAGFGFVKNQVVDPGPHATHDSVSDFRELSQIKVEANETGIILLGGGVPKNFTADTVVCGEVLGHDVKMHKYAVQLTVADERDGALSGSTLKEAHSWGKVDDVAEQMVFCEFSLAFPLMASYLYHNNLWKNRKERRLNEIFAKRGLTHKLPDISQVAVMPAKKVAVGSKK
jgi:deoxyhypusine synthase